MHALLSSTVSCQDTTIVLKSKLGLLTVGMLINTILRMTTVTERNSVFI